jgi:hypothetical protein
MVGAKSSADLEENWASVESILLLPIEAGAPHSTPVPPRENTDLDQGDWLSTS